MTLAATVVWEIRSDGSATNGGGYKSNAGTTDYSQQAAAQLSVSDAACSGNTTVTSSTGGFTAAMVGNVMYLSSGPGWYEITARTDTNTVTIDRNGPNASGMTCNVGGALNSIGTLGAIFQTAAHAVSGMIAYVRGGTYSLGSATSNVSTGPLDLDASEMDSKKFYLKGYDASEARTSFAGTRPIIDCATYTPTNTTVIELKGTLAENHVVAFIDVDCDGLNTNGIRGNVAAYDYCYSCIVRTNITSSGFYTVSATNCLADTIGGTGFYEGYNSGCIAKDCTGSGFYLLAGGAVDCIAYSGGSIGFQSLYGTIQNCVSYDNSGDGFDIARGGNLFNCVSWSDGGYAFDNATVHFGLFNCASDGAASGRSRTTPLIDIGNPGTLTADPFTNAAALDFSLNNTAGGGALLRQAGLSGYGQTGYKDIGAVRHADPSATSGGGVPVFGGNISRRV